MQKIEQTLSSIEVAEMVKKEHKYLMRDIRKYTDIMQGAKISPCDFWSESTYSNNNGQTYPCYRITKKGCEFIAHKMTGTKGTEFTARYINRFHEMQDMITEQAAGKQPDIPWFIRKFEMKYIILERDFIQITGVDITKHKLFYREEYFKGGRDYNGWGWYTSIDKKAFKKKYGFEYGDDKCMMYFYPCGVVKALRILSDDGKVQMNKDACAMITDGLKAISPQKKKAISPQNQKSILVTDENGQNLPVQINIICGRTSKTLI